MNVYLAEFVTKYETTLTIPKTSKGMPRYTSGKTREKKLQRSKMACLQRYIPDILKGEVCCFCSSNFAMNHRY